MNHRNKLRISNRHGSTTTCSVANGSQRMARDRSGVAFLMLILATSLIVIACTQTALRGVISERVAEQQRQVVRQLEAAIECTSSETQSPSKIVLPLSGDSDERIEVIRDGETITAKWMIGIQQRDSLTRTKP